MGIVLYAAGYHCIVGRLTTPETILIFLLALLLFGPRKLPEIGRAVAEALERFKRGDPTLRPLDPDTVGALTFAGFLAIALILALGWAAAKL